MTVRYAQRLLALLARLAGSSRARAVLLVVVLAFCAYGLRAEWPQASPALARMPWYSITLSLAAALGGSVCMMLGWRAVLADLGSALPVRAAARINFVAQLGKYVPGAVWAFAAQVELGHDYQVPRRRSFASVIISLAITVGSGLAVSAVALALASPATARHYWWALGAIPVLALALCPPVFGRAINGLLSLAGRQPLERLPSWRGLAMALCFDAAGWVFLGVQVWLLAREAADRQAVQLLLLATGGYALAFSVGLLLVVIPSGLGVREIILIATLAPTVGHPVAVATALLTRVCATVSDLTCGALGMAAGRRARQAPAADAVGLEAQLAPAKTSDSGRGRHRKPPGRQARIPAARAPR